MQYAHAFLFVVQCSGFTKYVVPDFPNFTNSVHVYIVTISKHLVIVNITIRRTVY